jgi:eukaryotic-like serine/threonine-protein kinase
MKNTLPLSLVASIIKTLFCSTALCFIVTLHSCIFKKDPNPKKEILNSENATIYLDGREKLCAFDANTGDIKWEYSEKQSYQDNGESNAVVKNGLVFSTDLSGNLYAVDAISGGKKWEYSIGVSDATPIIEGETIYISNRKAQLFAIETATGRFKWSYQPSGELMPFDYAYSSPTVSNNEVYFATWNGADGYGWARETGELFAVNKSSGELRGKYKSKSNSIESSPAISESMAYFGSGSGVEAVDMNTLKNKWTFATPEYVFSSPTISNGTLFAGCDDGNLYAINVKTGAKKWAVSTGYAVRSSPIVANNNVIFSAYGGVYALDVETGRQIWKYESTEWCSNPVAANDVVYLVNDHKLVALDLKSGKKWWEKATNTTIYSDPCILSKDGKVYNSGISGEHH